MSLVLGVVILFLVGSSKSIATINLPLEAILSGEAVCSEGGNVKITITKLGTWYLKNAFLCYCSFWLLSTIYIFSQEVLTSFLAVYSSLMQSAKIILLTCLWSGNAFCFILISFWKAYINKSEAILFSSRSQFLYYIIFFFYPIHIYF